MNEDLTCVRRGKRDLVVVSLLSISHSPSRFVGHLFVPNAKMHEFVGAFARYGEVVD